MPPICLGQISKLLKYFRGAPVGVIKLFHRLVFRYDGDRNNRKRLREFEGFKFEINSEEYKKTVKYMNDNFSINDLVIIANILCVDHNDNKSDLIKNICASLMDIPALANSLMENNDDSDSETELDIANGDDIRNQDFEVASVASGGSMASAVNSQNMQPTFAISFRDVEGSIKSFDGTGKYPVEKWIRDFEDLIQLLGWSELHAFIFAKKSLSGLAKLFIESENNIKSWNSLKNALISEFSTRVNSAELHRLLSDRKMRRDENVHEYFLVMKEIASRGIIEIDSLIYYIIDGIRDDSANKLILYGAKTLHEFKDKLRIYGEMKSRPAFVKHNHNQLPAGQNRYIKDLSKKFSQNNISENVGENKLKSERCYNCGKFNHKSSECRFKFQGTKCFRCNRFGHKSFECKIKQESPSVSNHNTDQNIKSVTENNPSTSRIETISSNTEKPIIHTNKMLKSVMIGDNHLHALIDTGSVVSLVKQSVYKNLNCPTLKKVDLLLSGFGRSKVPVIGSFKIQIKIDSNYFSIMLNVVPDETMSQDVILGTDFISQTEITIKQDGMVISKPKDELAIMNVDVACTDLDVGNTDCSISEKVINDVKNLVLSYKPQKIKDTDIKMKIILKDDEPIYHNPRRLPFAERDIVNKQVEEWIEKEIVEPCSSEYSSQVVVTKKKDGSHRICVDYRKINKLIVKDRFPIPIIEDQLDKLEGAKIFSTIDLKNGFFHVGVEQDSRKYTSFVTDMGQYQFLKVPFGLCNSPSVFQRFINTIFRDLMNFGIALPYLDDIIIPAKNEDEAVGRLKQVLRICQDYGLEINKKKCHLLKTRIEFLGHIIENGQIFPSETKTQAVLKFPVPKAVKNLQSFLGLTSYFRKFIPDYSIIAKPLSDLLKKDKKFEFKESQIAAFNRLKEILAKEPVLHIFQNGVETEVHTDASMWGYGAILMQKSSRDNMLHPVYYMSRKTTPAEQKYTSYELEVLAIIQALKKFRIYLVGQPFKIITDCAAFQKTMDKRELTTRVARWALLLEEFQYTIEHRSGTRMRHVDALSRYPIMMITCEDGITTRLKRAQETDEEILAIKEILKERKYKDYLLKDEILYKMIDQHEVIVLPKQMQTEIIKKFHDDGHFSSKKTADIIRQNYHIPNLKQKIDKIIACCVPCILSNRKRGKQEGLLHPLRKEEIPLHTYHVDHLGPLVSTSKNYKHILVIIDSFTKYVWVYPTKSTTSKEVIAKLELQKFNFGNPSVIISDRGTAFTSQEFEDYCKSENIQHFKITTGLPRSNGQVERINSIIINVLSKLSSKDPGKWFKYVNQLQLILNSTYQRSINTTPFQLLTGVKLRRKEHLEIQGLIEEESRKLFEENRGDLRQKAKEQIMKVQEENRKTYNLRRKPPTKYQVGDLVAIKRTQQGPGLKLKSKFLGPYKVTKIKDFDTYDVQQMESCRDGPFHTTTCSEYMKLWIPKDLDEVTDDDDHEYQLWDELGVSGSDTCQDSRVVGNKCS